jgi:MarR family transcriptional regulator, lower aerobic nicotinate degradation pathway regulator
MEVLVKASAEKLRATFPALADVPLPRVHVAPGYLIRVAQRVHTSLWASSIKSGITSIQYACLMVLGDHPEIDQGTLGVQVSVDKASIVDIVRRMVSANLVQRCPDPNDKRRWRLKLTPEGEAMLVRERPAVIEVQRSILSTLGEEESREWIRLLSTVVLGEPGQVTLPDADDLVMTAAPGYLIRRAQQKHWSLWNSLVSQSVTSVQYGALIALIENGPMGQRSLGAYLSIDKSTAGDVISRMHQRRLIVRIQDEEDRRKKMLSLNDIGSYVVKALTPSVFEVQEQLLHGLSSSDREMFVDLMSKICAQHKE